VHSRTTVAIGSIAYDDPQGKPSGTLRAAIEKTCAVTQNFCVTEFPVLDEFDHRLLELLQCDASVTLTALGDTVGLSASAVQRRIDRYRKAGLLREVAVLDAGLLPAVTLAAVWVTMERDTLRLHTAFRARMRAAPEVQQCYAVAGQWDYLVILVARSVSHYREVAERLFVDEGTVKRYETRLVFDTIKQGLSLPTRPPSRRGK
jgi:Lrp/AsnC family leucine-responsive transcriptional regulator